MEKHSPYPDAKPSMYSRAVAYGNMLFLSGVGYHEAGTIEDAHQRRTAGDREEPDRSGVFAAESA